jgi:indolepyruvate ferredoxin oxidoreductase, beta subunit
MKKDIILAGVGGQGILSIATIIGYAALKQNMQLKQAEVHGMSQRGGDVQSHLRISDEEIFSDLVPAGAADMIISVEPLESLRYIPFLSPEGWLLANSKPFVNITNYPDHDAVRAEIEKFPRHIILDADQIAKDCGNPKGMNMVILGAASLLLGLPLESYEEGIRTVFGGKGEEIVNLNLVALRKGREIAGEQVKK